MVEPSNESGRQLGLQLARIHLCEKGLSVKIGSFHCIGINDRKLSDTSPRKSRNYSTSYPARSDYGDVCGFELALTGSANLRKDNVPGVALELFVAEAHWPPITGRCCRSLRLPGWSRSAP